jgi:hypothetical protein
MPPPAPPPAAFLGQARALRASIREEDTAATVTIERFMRPLYARAQRHPVPREGDLAGVARAWRETLPAGGRLALNIEAKRKTIAIDELRISSIDFRFANWSSPDFEPGLALILLRLRVSPKTGFELETPILAGVSLHALARRYQRGFVTTREAVLADVAQTAATPVARTFLG